MLTTLVLSGIALLIVGGGGIWAVIWLLSGPSHPSQKYGSAKLRSLPAWVLSVWALTAVYAAVYYVFAVVVGGTPPRHSPEDGKYWLTWSGHYTEVSRSTFFWSEVREVVLFLLIGVCVYALCKVPKPNTAVGPP